MYKKVGLFSFVSGFAVALTLSFILPKDDNLRIQAERLPQAFQILGRQCYTLCYDGRNKGPLWVYERLKIDSLKGDASRNGMRFKEDIDIPVSFRSSLKDYKNTGFDRGHMCPAGDCPQTFESMEETFLLSNISPQQPDLNRGLWKALEARVRELAKSSEEIHVYTGPLYLPKNASDGKRYVKYQVIGKNDVAVPTHFYKMVRIGEGSLAYIIPNTKIELSDLQGFEVPIEKLEKLTGFKFP